MQSTLPSVPDRDPTFPPPPGPPSSPRAERARLFFVEWIFSSLGGLSFGDWMRLLWQNGFAVDPPYWPRAAFLTLTSLITSQDRWRESWLHDRKIAATPIQPPLFILGHWRSGTTHLHNLLAVDRRFNYPTLFQAFYPRVFLGSHWTYSKISKVALTRNRIIDNVAHGIEMPNEDEFALNVLTFLSSYMGMSFPRRQEHYDRFLTMRDVSGPELARWRAAFVFFLKKLTYKDRRGRPIVLKSPPHTCRIRPLLDLFPEAKFVHIHRDPFVVFGSTRQHETILGAALRFQKSGPADHDTRIIERYRVMYDLYFEERGLIPAGRLHEIRFEDLERDPLGQVQALYERLGLPEFAEVRPALGRYVDSLAGYRKNVHAELPPELRRRIAREWRRSFEEWGYPTA